MHFVQPNPKAPHLTFIGGGTLARAILDGLSKYDAPKTEHSAMYSVSITARRKESVGQLRQQYLGAYVTDDNEDEKLWNFATANTPAVHIVLICTQPQSTFDVCKSIRLAHEKTLRTCQSLPIVVTMCPGITIPTLESWLTLENHSKPFSVVRTMPNTPVSICQGATALATSRHVEDIELDSVVKLFRIFSPCVERLPKEELLDVAAAVSGSGPAYIFEFYKSLVAAAVELGISESLARSLIMQTGVGSSLLAKRQPKVSLDQMIKNVCVPGGSTEKGMKSLENAGFEMAIADAVKSSLKANKAMKHDK